MSDSDRVITTNRRAFHDYFIDDRFEAGIVLTGTEIKSLRAGRISLADGYARILNDEAFLENVHIAPYEQGARENPEPLRRRKLLLHRAQIRDLFRTVRQKGFTIVPLRVYLTKGRAKVELGLARGKKQYDKRQAIAERDARRDIERTVNSRIRGRNESRG